MLKKIAIGVGLVIVALAVGVYYLSQNAGKIVQAVIESQGSRVTQVAVKVDGVDVNLPDLKAGIRGLSIANPPGFKTPNAVNLGEISVKLDENWSPSRVVIDEVMVRAPEITYEIGASGSNIDAIRRNVENFMKIVKGGSGASSPSASQDDTKSTTPKVVINDLYIKNGRVNISATLMRGKSLSAPLPESHLRDIGKDSGGATPAEIADQVIAAITKASGNAAGSVDLSQLGLADITGKALKMGGDAAKAVRDAAEGAAKSKIKDVIDDATQGAGDAGKAAKDALEGAGGALKGLFDKK